MEIEVLMVANAASKDDGLLSVEGGGWEHYGVDFFPATVTGVIAGILVLQDEERDSTPTIRVTVDDDRGLVDASAGAMVVTSVRPPTAAGVPLRSPFVLPFTIVVREATVVRFALSDDSGELGARTFVVKSNIPDSLAD